jgi:hypothetical protein
LFGKGANWAEKVQPTNVPPVVDEAAAALAMVDDFLAGDAGNAAPEVANAQVSLLKNASIMG